MLNCGKGLGDWISSTMYCFFNTDRSSDVLDNAWYTLDTKVSCDTQPGFGSPKLNVKDCGKTYEVDIAIPGFNKDDVSIEVKDSVLYIGCGGKKNEDDKGYLMKEIVSGSFLRAVRFPEKIDVNNIDCTYENGIIACTINKQSKKECEIVKININ